MSEVIKVNHLVKSYGNRPVIRGISFTVRKGEIFALLGVNGAGKTTTLECMEGLRKQESGTIQVEGNFAVQLQSSSLPQNIKAIEAVSFFAKWRGVSVNKESLERIGVMSFKNKQYRELSTGQKRRLHLALAMLGDPDIVFLDEPTAGLDVEGRASLHEEIRRLKGMGKTIIVASHDMAEVEELCDRIAILKEGSIAFLGTTADLAANFQGISSLQIRFSKRPVLEELKHSIFQKEDRGFFVFETENLTESVLEIVSQVREQNISIQDIKVGQINLEQHFLTIAKGE